MEFSFLQSVESEIWAPLISWQNLSHLSLLYLIVASLIWSLSELTSVLWHSRHTRREVSAFGFVLVFDHGDDVGWQFDVFVWIDVHFTCFCCFFDGSLNARGK